jgi:adenosylcobyric acid synthase
MFVGTGSDVGKSIINTAFCRIFKQDGHSPAPFKAQNMSLNSYATRDGLEIGRAQAVQAEASGLDCTVEMNPILLKPTSNLSAQVVLNGKPVGNQSAKEFFNADERDFFFEQAIKSYHSLAKTYSPIVIEGAGSISEVNLWDKDITNMRIAMETDAATYLVADIDRGGVIASIYGTMMLLPEAQRQQIKGFIINKFRGDIDLFADGKEIIEKLTGKPVVGIVPYYTDIFIDEEDSVPLVKKNSGLSGHKINIAVVRLPHLSNFTDFNYLEQIEQVNLFYTEDAADVVSADIVILPGTKNTIEDLLYIRGNGVATALIQRFMAGKPIYGICGGYQMMGDEIKDPCQIEGPTKEIAGLGILPVTTTITQTKNSTQCRFQFLNQSGPCLGYEIHMGLTTGKDEKPLCHLDNSATDGYYLNPNTFGTYIHGIFDNAGVVQFILQQVGYTDNIQLDALTFRNQQYDKLADFIRQYVDVGYIYQTMEQQ